MVKYERDSVWVYSSSPKVGKWYLSGSITYIRKLFPKIHQLVQDGVAYSAKYSHKKDLDSSPLPFELPVLCVFCEDSTKERVLEELVKLGTKKQDWRWKYNSETQKDWEEGGNLYERSQRQRKEYQFLRLQEAEKEQNNKEQN